MSWFVTFVSVIVVVMWVVFLCNVLMKRRASSTVVNCSVVKGQIRVNVPATEKYRINRIVN